MVSRGTDASRAFWNMVRSEGFMSGSGPPSRAATSTWRISLAKTFARLASVAPFLCLIVAHLEWPDMRSPRLRRPAAAGPTFLRHFGQVQELLVEAEVAGQLRMERGDHH